LSFLQRRAFSGPSVDAAGNRQPFAVLPFYLATADGQLQYPFGI
jgi:hypothetical protein